MTTELERNRHVMRERQQYIKVVGAYPPTLGGSGSFLSQNIGQHIAQAMSQGIPWEQHYALGDPAGPNLLQRMYGQLPAWFVDAQLARAHYKVQFGVDRGATLDQLAGDIEGTIWALGFDPDSPEYPGGPMPPLEELGAESPAASAAGVAPATPAAPPEDHDAIDIHLAAIARALGDNRVTAKERTEIRSRLEAIRTLLPTILIVLVAATGFAQPVRDSAHVRAARVIADSIAAETCRGGRLSASGLTCTGATASPRVTVIRRLKLRGDSLERASLPAVPTPTRIVIDSVFVWTSHPQYRSGYEALPVPSQDTVTVCARITWADGRVTVGVPPIRLQTLGDSAAWTVRSGNTMSSMCGPVLGILATTPVTWDAGRWIRYGALRLFRPGAVP